ncbi:hypothetical protein SNE40_013180 [Patella caerulea]|uniref:Uncharacterized protein n=1 Tax=Patella caerulea TaxID=87958 RepID=A0AAN8JN16_PATCE
MYGGGFGVVNPPPMVYEPGHRFIQRPRLVAEYPPRAYYRHHIDRKIKYVLPHNKKRPLVVKKTYDAQDARLLHDPHNAVVPAYDYGKELYDGGYWYPPDINRPHRTAPTYINYKVKPLLPPIVDGFYRYPDKEYERFQRDIVRDNSQTYPSENSWTPGPVVRRDISHIFSVSARPRFYYHPARPVRVEYVDDYDERSMVPMYRPRREQFLSVDQKPNDSFRKRRLQYLMEQRRQQGLL